MPTTEQTKPETKFEERHRKLAAAPQQQNSRWQESFWNQNVWYYQTQQGYSAKDEFNRTIHQGSMLPALSWKHYKKETT